MTQTVIKEKLESHRVDLIIKLLSAFKKNKSSYNLINNTDKVTVNFPVAKVRPVQSWTQLCIVVQTKK